MVTTVNPVRVRSATPFHVLFRPVAYGYTVNMTLIDSAPASDKPERTPERKGRLSAEDWAQAALDLIAEQGVAALAVEPLARRLGVTKGSFYWHFPSRDALLQAALERWESFEQEAVFGTLEAVSDPRERLRDLFQLVAHEARSHVVFSALLKAMDHPAVQPVMARVSQRRLDYLTASFRQAGLGRSDARHRARLAYAAYVGFLQLSLQLQQSRPPREEFEAYVEHMMATLIPPVSAAHIASGAAR